MQCPLRWPAGQWRTKAKWSRPTWTHAALWAGRRLGAVVLAPAWPVPILQPATGGAQAERGQACPARPRAHGGRPGPVCARQRWPSCSWSATRARRRSTTRWAARARSWTRWCAASASTAAACCCARPWSRSSSKVRAAHPLWPPACLPSFPGGRRTARVHAGPQRARGCRADTRRTGLARDGACSRARRARRRARGGRAAGAARRARGRGRARGRRGRQQRVRVGHAAPAAARRRAGGLAQRGAADAAHWQLRAPACRCGPQPACAGAGGAPHTPYMRPCAAGRCIRRAVAVRDCAPSACSRFMCMARGPAVHACGSLRCCAPAAGSPEQCGACECWCGRDAGAARLTRTLARVWPRPSSPELPPSCRSSAASAVRCNAKQQRAPAGAGIDADGLPPDLECHHLFVNSWEGLDAPQACGPAARAFRGVCGGCRDARMTEHWAGQSGCGRRSRRITCIVGVQ